ncbi:MAG: arylesterase [Bacteroidota bacterium]
MKVQMVSVLLILVACSGPTQQKSEVNTTTANNSEETAAEEERKVILFFGNSITAGYELDMDLAFPALIQARLDSLGYNYRCVNAGLSGETSAGGKSRIDWVLRTKPDIFFLELGANDGLRGLPLEETPVNLQSILDQVKQVNPDVQIIIAGMMVPPNLGKDYSAEFFGLFPKLAKDNKAELIPFLLDGVAGFPSLNLSDGIHPNAEGHKIVAETVWNAIRPVIEKDTTKLIGVRL